MSSYKMDLWIPLLLALLVLVEYIVKSAASDCKNEIKFESKVSIESWCMTNIDDCSLGSLRSSSNLSTLFNSSSWHSPGPEFLRVTSYCEKDPNDVNQAGVRFSWKPPSDQGASFIQGFEIRLEGYSPGYRCIVIKLKEDLTQSVVDSVISGSISPVKRNQDFVLLVFSLPRTDKSGIIHRPFRSPNCETGRAVSSKWTTDLTSVHDQQRNTLNVSFPPPPDQFNFTMFELTMSNRNAPNKLPISVTINETFHVFTSIEPGKYRLTLEPYNPHPFDSLLCTCRNDRDGCAFCYMSRKDINLTRRRPISTPPLLTTNKRKWTTKVVIKSGKRKNKRRKGDKKENEDDRGDKPHRVLVRVILPLCVLMFCIVCVAIWFVYVSRRRRRFSHCCKSKTSGDESTANSSVDKDATERRCLIVVDANVLEKQRQSETVQSEFMDIVKGMLGNSVVIHQLRYSSVFQYRLRDCLRQLVQQRDMRISEYSGTKDHDCSETSLIENKPSNDHDIKLNCCTRHVPLDVNILVLVFIDSSTPATVLEACKSICDSFCDDTTDCKSVCISQTKADLPSYTLNMTSYSYKYELSSLLNFVKDTLLKRESVNKTEKVTNQTGMSKQKQCLTNNDNTDMFDQCVDIRNTPESESQWIDWPEGVHISQAPWVENAAKRKRYVSSDSGWGTSEHSFRSTPIEEVNERSNKSSLQSFPGTEHVSVSPQRTEFIDGPRVFDQSPMLVAPLMKRDPISFTMTPPYSIHKCPSDISFIPPDALTLSETDARDDSINVYSGDTNLARVQSVPCKHYTDSPTKKINSERRQSPSMDMLMDMMKAINDESTRYMEHDASPGDVYSVFEGMA